MSLEATTLKPPEESNGQPLLRDEKEHFIYSFCFSFRISEKPCFEVIDQERRKAGTWTEKLSI